MFLFFFDSREWWFYLTFIMLKPLFLRNLFLSPSPYLSLSLSHSFDDDYLVPFSYLQIFTQQHPFDDFYFTKFECPRKKERKVFRWRGSQVKRLRFIARIFVVIKKTRRHVLKSSRKKKKQNGPRRKFKFHT